ncbi:hypothetical protein EIP86_002004 [Pleurotus ostreatoroseus]|nr:hypothetical protein EIP86_002004 [Pleurotus ostreatoroseus]
MSTIRPILLQWAFAMVCRPLALSQAMRWRPDGSLRCHLGKTIRYDTVSKKRWGVDIRTHGIAVIIERLLAEDWDDDDAGDNTRKEGVPPFVEEDDCVAIPVTRTPVFDS